MEATENQFAMKWLEMQFWHLVFTTEESLKYRALLYRATRAVGLPHCGYMGVYGFCMKGVIYHK